MAIDAPEKPQPSNEQRMEALSALKKTFGGTSKIPEDQLTTIGYSRRIAEDGTIHLIPLDYLSELEERKARRISETPFGRTPVRLATREGDYRFIPLEQVSSVLEDKLQEVEYALYPNWQDGTGIIGDQELEPRLQNLGLFAVDFCEFLQNDGIDGIKIHKNEAENILFAPLPQRLYPSKDRDEPNNFNYEGFLEDHTDDDGSIGSEKGKTMYEGLSTLQAFFCDTPFLTRQFRANLSKPLEINEVRATGIRQADYERDQKGIAEQLSKLQLDLSPQLEKLGIKSYADFIRWAVPKYLNHIGLSDLGEVVSHSTNLDELPTTIRSARIVPPQDKQLFDLKQTMKSASPEERRTLSGQIKELEEGKKRTRQIVEGLVDYFDAPAVYAEICKRKIKTVQDFLLSGGKKVGHRTFYLDATPNFDLDRNPGHVSGDCTDGKPLPFNIGSVHAHNVKVFSDQGKHVGNIYLLNTNEISLDEWDKPDEDKSHEADNKNRDIWHLDAIQIPSSGIDWKEATKSIVDTLSIIAREKGVKAITVNQDKSLISNYDYIQDGVEAFWQVNSNEGIYVRIPKLNLPEHTDFQGDGSALVLWRDKE